MNYICALCNEGLIYDNKYIGDPTETSLYNYLYKKGLDPLKIRKDKKRLIDAPFNSERKIASTINKIGNKTYLLCKGSIDSLLKRCNYLDKTILNETEKKLIKEEEEKLSNKSLRVLGFAYK